MIALINTNLTKPPIAPIGVEYLAGALRARGEDVQVLDFGLADGWIPAVWKFFDKKREPELVGLSFRNVDDSFWPSAESFVPELKAMVSTVRAYCRAPLVLGGVGFSIFPEAVVKATGADYGIAGDGEEALPPLLRALRKAAPGKPPPAELAKLPGLVWREKKELNFNPPLWAAVGAGAFPRDIVDNRTYLHLGGQLGLETKRGCPRRCDFCADWAVKGAVSRCRAPKDVADEAQALARQGLDVLHLCDSEFNVPVEHALSVCDEFIRRGLGEKLRWYAYLAAWPFPAELAAAMRKAGCVGINFTGLVGALGPTAHWHTAADGCQSRARPEVLAATVRQCRAHGIAAMVDTLFGGPGETPETVAEGVALLKQIEPDCVGAALGVRLYPNLPLTARIAAEAPLDEHPGVRRFYDGPVDLLQPTYYISPLLGRQPAALIRQAIGTDSRFFAPSDAPAGEHRSTAAKGYNYNENAPLVAAIAAGARGAYWDILRKLGQKV